VISTVAGNGSSHSSGIPASSAAIVHPQDIATDKFGNTYYCSGAGHNIRKIDAAGIITTIAGTGTSGYSGDGGPAIAAQLSHPGGICIDSIGNIYVADKLNNRIRKIDVTTGIISTVVGTGVNGYNGENILALSADLFNVSDVCFDKFGNLYLSEQQNPRIRKVAPSGVVTTYVGNGVTGNSGDGGQATLAQVAFPSELICDSAGHLYFSDFASISNCVRKVDRFTGIISTIAGTSQPVYNGDNILATSANITPARICFDRYYNLFISDQINCRVRKVDQNGIIHTIAGDGTFAYGGDGGAAVDAQLNRPAGIAFDTCGNLYLTEIQQGRIRKVSFNPHCWPMHVNELKPLSFTLSPNPATSQITITSTTKLQEIYVYSIMGQQVLWQGGASDKVIVDLEGLTLGVYFVKVRDVNGAQRTEKIIKQ